MTRRRTLWIALLFLLPNLVGFVVFTAGPVVFSLWMSLTDWALTRHNAYSDTPIDFVGLENYARLLVGDESELFWGYFYNTIFLMLGIPISIAASLGLALLLNKNIGPQRLRTRAGSVAIAVLATLLTCAVIWVFSTPGPMPEAGTQECIAASADSGLGNLSNWRVAQLRSQTAVLAVALLGALVAAGLAIGPVFFRTVFYLPSMLAGVAIFLLWKTLYRSEGGLINASLRPALDSLQAAVVSTPNWLWYGFGVLLWTAGGALCLWMLWRGVRALLSRDISELSLVGLLLGTVCLGGAIFGLGYVCCQLPQRSLFASELALLSSTDLREIGAAIISQFPAADAEEVRLLVLTLGDQIRPATAIAQFADLGLDGSALRDIVMQHTQPLHQGLTFGDGLRPPEWLTDRTWAKPALIIMGIWTAAGGGNMLLYLAGLSNIPAELYEAADIDGARGWQRFAHVTWPQLAPTTFFIVIMSTIGGLQGGFDQARVMTEGKYGTTVLSYYLYNVAFDDQFQLGLASAIAWVMFIMIFLMTLANYRFGSRATNL